MKIYNFFPQISFKNGHVHLSISKQFCKFQQVPEAIQVMQDSNLFGCVIFFFFLVTVVCFGFWGFKNNVVHPLVFIGLCREVHKHSKCVMIRSM